MSVTLEHRNKVMYPIPVKIFEPSCNHMRISLKAQKTAAGAIFCVVYRVVILAGLDRGGLLLELEGVQHLLQALAGREDHAGIGDAAYSQIAGDLRSLAGDVRRKVLLPMVRGNGVILTNKKHHSG